MNTIPRHPNKPISRPFTKREKKHIAAMAIFSIGTIALFALLLTNTGPKVGHATKFAGSLDSTPSITTESAEDLIEAGRLDFSGCVGTPQSEVGETCDSACRALSGTPVSCLFALRIGYDTVHDEFTGNSFAMCSHRVTETEYHSEDLTCMCCP